MNLTIASNGLSGSTSLIGFQIANGSGTLRLHNSIIAGTNSNVSGTITDDGYNICSDGTAQFSSGSSYNYTDPKLGPLADYGGPTLCMALLSGSPAIDSGGSAGLPATDQRGFARPFGAGPDMGAYEYGAYEPACLFITGNATNILLTFKALPIKVYRLQTSTNLSTWSNLNTIGAFSYATNVNQVIAHQSSQRCFYRVQMQ
jgi:hypothetical protein